MSQDFQNPEPHLPFQDQEQYTENAQFAQFNNQNPYNNPDPPEVTQSLLQNQPPIVLHSSQISSILAHNKGLLLDAFDFYNQAMSQSKPNGAEEANEGKHAKDTLKKEQLLTAAVDHLEHCHK